MGMSFWKKLKSLLPASKRQVRNLEEKINKLEEENQKHIERYVGKKFKAANLQIKHKFQNTNHQIINLWNRFEQEGLRELLNRQNDLLQKQNDMLKRQNDMLQKQGEALANYNTALGQANQQLKSLQYIITLQDETLSFVSENNFGITKDKRSRQLIISLTSYKKRIDTLPIVLNRLLCQTVKPDHIVLYLAKDNFPLGEEELPERLLGMQNRGLEIKWCEKDIKSYKKIIPALKDYPDDIIITVDDDVFYDLDLVEKLYNSYKRFPDAVSAMRVHRMKFDNENNLLLYSEWQKEVSDVIGEPTMSFFPTGVGGVLYPPHCMHEEVLNEDNFMKLCPNADDVWLKFMTVMNNFPVVAVDMLHELKYIPGTQEECLWKTNFYENDIQIKQFLDVYNQFQKDEPSLLECVSCEENWIGSAKYWEQRYKKGGNSGAGSYNRLSEFKADILNAFVKEHDIDLVVEWGHGDGNQLKLAKYPKYIGFDISKTAVDMCKKMFAGDQTKEFVWSGGEDFECKVKGDLTLSLDVIYHLVEDEVFETYMNRLFDTSRQYVCIYSCNFDKNHAEHVRCRKFTTYIEENIKGWELIEKVENKYPYDEADPDNTSWLDFYFYKKVTMEE